MTNQRSKQIRKIYGILLSVVIVIAGICLMAACRDIYFTGDHTFSREIVAAHFGEIAIPVYLCLAMVIIGFLLDLFLPGETSKNAVEKNYTLILQRLHDKTDLSLCDEGTRASVIREQKLRKCHKIVTIILLVIGSIVFMCYALNGNNFHPREINDSIIQAVILLVPCMAIPFAYAVFSAYYCRASMQREIELMKQAGVNRSPAPKRETRNGKASVVLRWAVLAAAAAILVYGYAVGGTADVLTKAINICTECVGLG